MVGITLGVIALDTLVTLPTLKAKGPITPVAG